MNKKKKYKSLRFMFAPLTSDRVLGEFPVADQLWNELLDMSPDCRRRTLDQITEILRLSFRSHQITQSLDEARHEQDPRGNPLAPDWSYLFTCTVCGATIQLPPISVRGGFFFKSPGPVFCTCSPQHDMLAVFKRNVAP